MHRHKSGGAEALTGSTEWAAVEGRGSRRRFSPAHGLNPPRQSKDGDSRAARGQLEETRAPPGPFRRTASRGPLPKADGGDSPPPPAQGWAPVLTWVKRGKEMALNMDPFCLISSSPYETLDAGQCQRCGHTPANPNSAAAHTALWRQRGALCWPEPLDESARPHIQPRG